MAPRASRVHWDRLDERAFTVVTRAIGHLEAAGIPYVLAGGWAAYAYGTGVPSVDADAFVPRSAWPALEASIPADLRQGEARLELLDMDGLNALLGADPELGIQEEGYVPADLFRGRTRRAHLELPGHRLAATVPRPDALLLTKLKAYHDRELAWRALRAPEVMATLSPGDRAEVRRWTDSYCYRKAGKDLYDVACLATRATTLDEALSLARAWGLERVLRDRVRRPPFPLVELAADFARVRGQDDVEAWLSALGAA